MLKNYNLKNQKKQKLKKYNYMRVLRFILLNTNFLTSSKNKKKALMLINVGIFLTIFAITSALITFTIEKKIADKEEELIYLQISAKEYGKLITEIESALNMFESIFSYEEDSMIDKEYFANIKIGSRLISQNDFYKPYIYYALMDAQTMFSDFDKDEFNIFDENDQFYQYIYEYISEWEEDNLNAFKTAVKDFIENYKKIENINFIEFNLEKIPTYQEIVNEIKKGEEIDLLSNSQIGDNHTTVRDFDLAAMKWMIQMLKFFKSYNAAEMNLIEEVSIEILSLSEKEKNIILITFIFQFFIFVIIQFFEINSFNINLKKKK